MTTKTLTQPVVGREYVCGNYFYPTHVVVTDADEQRVSFTMHGKNMQLPTDVWSATHYESTEDMFYAYRPDVQRPH